MGFRANIGLLLCCATAILSSEARAQEAGAPPGTGVAGLSRKWSSLRRGGGLSLAMRLGQHLQYSLGYTTLVAGGSLSLDGNLAYQSRI